MSSTTYVFNNDNIYSTEQHRCLAAAYDPITTERLAATGVAEGWSCLEVGAGGGSIAHWLADRVAPSGSVLATDIKPQQIRPRPALSVIAHDIVADPLPLETFDLINARLVLRNLNQRRAVLDKLVRALKPGGWLQIDEFDASYEPLLVVDDPRDARLYRTFLEAKAAVMEAAGMDVTWGRHVAAAMREAGLVAIDPRPHIWLRSGKSPEMDLQVNHTFHLEGALLSRGMTEQQLADLRALLRNPSFRTTSSVLYSVQARKADER